MKYMCTCKFIMKYIFVSIIAVVNSVSCVSQDDKFCSKYSEDMSEDLAHCHFESYGNYLNSTVTCALILNYYYPFHIYKSPEIYHVTLIFKVGEIISNNICLRLASVRFEHTENGVSEKYAYNTYTVYSQQFDVFWGNTYGFIKMDLNYSSTIAVMMFNQKCEKNPLTKIIICPTVLVRLSTNIVRQIKILQSMDYPIWFFSKFLYKYLEGYNLHIYLSLGDSSPLQIPQKLSKHLNNMDIMELTVNGGIWGNLQQNLIKDMINLKVLDLSNNSLSYITGDNFKEIPNLEILILANNFLKTLPCEILYLRLLQKLDISNNPTINISSTYSCVNENLTTENASIDLCENSMKLQVLNLSFCEISFLPVTDMFCLKSLKVFDISHNNLSQFPSELFSPEANLTFLNISNNILETCPNFLLHNSMNIIDLSNNKLKSFDCIIKSKYLDILDLSKNSIAGWPEKNLDIENINNLNLSHSNISVVTDEMIKSFRNLTSIDLGGNPFNCTQPLIDFQKWLRNENKSVKVLNLGTRQQITCTSPLTEQDKYITQVEFDEILISESKKYLVGVGVSTGLLSVLLVAVLSCQCYRYRYEIAYMVHILKRKRTSAERLRNENETTFKWDAFVCYSGQDRSWVIGELMPALENDPESYRLCLHDRDFPLGSFISQSIVDSLNMSRKTIMVLTRHFIESDWCRWELELANHKVFEGNSAFLIFIIREKLNEDLLPRHLLYLMDTCTSLYWPENSKNVLKTWNGLKSALGPSMKQHSVRL